MATTAMGVPFLAKKNWKFHSNQKDWTDQKEICLPFDKLVHGELSKFLQQSIQKGRESRKLTTKIIQILLYFPNKGRI